MKRIIFFTIAVFLLSQLHAVETHFSLETHGGYTGGCLSEIIYHEKDPSKKISLLEWDRNLLFLGIGAHLFIGQFQIQAGLDYGVSRNLGKMEDSDWLNMQDYGMKTTFSTGDTDSLKNYQTDFSVFFEFPLEKSVSLLPVFNVQYAYDSFSRGKDARGWYGHSEYSSDGKHHNWYDEQAKEFPYVETDSKGHEHRYRLGQIDFNRHSVWIWAGLEARMKVGQVDFSIGLFSCPFAWFCAEDTHYSSGGTSVIHLVQKTWFDSLKFTADFSYRFNQRLSLVVNGSFMTTQESRGDLYDDWYYNGRQETGTKTVGYSVKTGVRVNIF